MHDDIPNRDDIPGREVNDMTDTEYILLDDEEGTFETFDDADELEEYLADQGFESEDGFVPNLRVFSVGTEYKVKASFDLEEVEE
jgi:hypothetical protein